MLDPKITFLIAAIVRPFLGASRKFGEWLPLWVPRQPATSPRSPRHYPGLFADESPAAVAQDRRPADPARRVLHAAARGKRLDLASLSSDPRAHRAAGVASEMIGRTVPQHFESMRTGVSPWAGCASGLASTEAQSGRWRLEDGPYHGSRSVRIGSETVSAGSAGRNAGCRSAKSQIPANIGPRRSYEATGDDSSDSGVSGSRRAPRPVIVLVHGAFADASGWSRVIPILQRDGYFVTAVQIPLTSLSDDIETAKRVVDSQKGP